MEHLPEYTLEAQVYIQRLLMSNRLTASSISNLDKLKVKFGVNLSRTWTAVESVLNLFMSLSVKTADFLTRLLAHGG
jgi:hypothetical protein